MAFNHRTGRRTPRSLASVLIGTTLVALILVGGGGVTATPNNGNDPHRHSALHSHQSAALSMLANLEPPPPPSAPAAVTNAWKTKVKGVQPTVHTLAVTPAATTSGGGVNASATAKTLVLYDSTGSYAFIGEEYGIGAANLSSHFGSWTAEPVVSYTSGQINNYTAVIYLGSTYNEPIPTAFLDDVLATTKPVMWSYDNIWQLGSRNPTQFVSRYGWDATQSYFDASSMSSTTPVNQVQYKGKALTRDGVDNLSGILNPDITNASAVQVLANAVRSDGTTLPWAIRSANLTYIGEVPFSYMKEEDRIIAFNDLMFDLYGQTQVRHRAMVRLEDIDPTYDTSTLKAVADYLYSQGVPFGFGVIPVYTDPLGYYTGTNCTAGVKCGPSQRVTLHQVTDLINTLKYLTAHGGTMIDHGYTHQWDGGINPYDEVSGDDFEFYRTVQNADHTLTYSGPIPGDSTTWANGRINSAKREFSQAGLPAPTIFEFPHYAGSATDYKAVGAAYNTRWERSLYFNGLLTGSTVSYTHIFGQLFPYPIKDVYGTTVLPENLGNIEPVPFYQFPTRSAAQLINAADLNLAVRDGIATFYFHPFWFYDDNGHPTTYLQDTVTGIKGLGYIFVNPATAASS